MKSIVVRPLQNFSVIEKETPKAGGNRVLIRSKYTAICGSDRGTWMRQLDKAIGHEFAGYVEDPGEFPIAKGTPVCAPEFNPCGECEFCKAGEEQRCRHMMENNPGVTVDGSLGEFYTVRGDYIIPIPEDMPMQLGAIVEPVAVSLHGVRLGKVQPGDSVLVWGNGPIGIYAAATAKLSGAKAVYMVGRGKGRVELCKKYDFVDDCFSTLDEDFEEQLKAVMPEGGFSAGLDCLGLSDYTQLAGFLKGGATMVLVGMHSRETKFNPFALFFKELSIQSALYFNWKDYQDAFRMIYENQELFLGTITSIIPAEPEEIQKMFVKLFESGSNDECKALIEFR